jgi:hypothetical protein
MRVKRGATTSVSILMRKKIFRACRNSSSGIRNNFRVRQVCECIDTELSASKQGKHQLVASDTLLSKIGVRVIQPFTVSKKARETAVAFETLLSKIGVCVS